MKDSNWHQFRKMDCRDNLEDAQKILDVLNETDIIWTAYGLIIEPVYSKEDSKSLVS